jgi:hypothetical protein
MSAVAGGEVAYGYAVQPTRAVAVLPAEHELVVLIAVAQYGHRSTVLVQERRSPPVCGCSSTTPASSSIRRPRSASRRSSKTVTASPADT